MTVRGGPHQGGLLPGELARAHVRAVREQQLDGVRAPGARRGHERRLAARQRGVGILAPPASRRAMMRTLPLVHARLSGCTP